MLELFPYPQRTFPEVFKWQALSFMRVAWPSIFSGENQFMEETYPPEHDPIHFVLAHGSCLISYAAILKLDLIHQGVPYKIFGFGNLFTFPPYQDRGYGSQVLHRATEYLRTSDADAGILFCNHNLEGFYARYGWTASHSRTLIGPVEDQQPYEELRMMQYPSEKAARAKMDFEQYPLSIPWPW